MFHPVGTTIVGMNSDGTADLLDYLRSVATFVGLLAGVTVALGVLAKSPVGTVGRFVWRHLFGDPLGAWTRHQVEAVVDLKLDALAELTVLADIPSLTARIDALTVQVAANAHRIDQFHLATGQSRRKGDPPS